MAANDKPSFNNDNKGKKRKYLPHGKSVRKGLYPLRPGVQGFFITCDGGRERQANGEALSLLDTFYEELVYGNHSDPKCEILPSKPMNKITKFEDSDSSDDGDDSPQKEKATEKTDTIKDVKRNDGEDDSYQKEDTQEKENTVEDAEKDEASPIKKQRLETDASKCQITDSDKSKDKPIDDLIEDELKEMGDRNKRHFVGLDSGCNGCIFIQMHKSSGDPGPASIVQHMMTSAASTRKHMSRFILRVVPAEVTCYASEEEISKAIKPLIEKYFPTEAPSPKKFAVLFEARANTGVQRMTIINAVAKSVPLPHKVDLTNPDKTIIVQVAKGIPLDGNQKNHVVVGYAISITFHPFPLTKTICMVGVVERYKELSKYNLRQLTTPPN